MTRRYALQILGSFLALSSQKALASTPKIGVKIGFVPISDHLCIIASKLYKSENFMIVPIKFASWVDLAEALRAGAIDGAFMLAPLGLMLRANGAKIKTVLSAHKNGSALVARSDVAGLKQLAGKKIAVPSKFSMHYFLLDTILKRENMSADVTEMAPPEMPFALLSHQIDAYIVAEPFGQMAVNFKGRAKNLLFSKDIKPNHICCTLNFQEEILSKPYFNELLDAFRKAASFITKDHEKSALLGNEILSQNANLLKLVLDKEIVSYDDLSLKAEELEELKEFLISKNLGNQKLANLDINSYLEQR
ncbi:twin-arginine translocation pathway signal protein [Campylobacter concisus]|uniref:Twin-arginine translocation pathway signal protein n=1 Tax=Campylobacter concisus TaxID=199 RepID=A0A1Y5MZ51_9BACT|nr:ABC transporter substrate-binding protein [Campylobacter concisus]OUT10902.1 twin-arginine translocation pathway signal protein [Campylobacter concisus]